MSAEPVIRLDRIEQEDEQILLQRKVVLDSLLMSMTLHGVEYPPEWAEEFVAIQNELNRRQIPFPTLNDEYAFNNWLGKSIGDYKIVHLLEDGLYWFLFEAEGKGGEHVTFKIARDCAHYDSRSIISSRPTRLYSIDGDIVREVRPDQNVLLRAEIQRLLSLVEENRPELPIVDESGVLPMPGLSSAGRPLQYFRTASVAGDRLADLLKYGTGRNQSFEIISMFSQIASSLEAMLRSEGFIYHGNLKPENIIFTAGGIYFRELGDFCSLSCADVLEPEVRITTPQYYPWLDVDDIGALGACLWEALTDYHPFDDTRAAEGDCILGADMRALIDFELSLANMHVLPLLNIKRPHQMGLNTTEKLETLLFKSIKMRVGEDGLIHEDPGYSSMAEFSDALLDLLNGPAVIF